MYSPEEIQAQKEAFRQALLNARPFKPLPHNKALAESLGLNGGTARVVGFAGKLREKKGLHPLLSAYARVHKRNPSDCFSLATFVRVKISKSSRSSNFLTRVLKLSSQGLFRRWICLPIIH